MRAYVFEGTPNEILKVLEEKKNVIVSVKSDDAPIETPVVPARERVVKRRRKIGGKKFASRFKPWSNDDIKYLAENYGKASISKLSSHLKRTKSSIRVKAYSLGLTRATIQHRWTEDELNRLRTLMAEGVSVNEAARVLKVSVAAVQAKLKNRG